MSIDLKACTQCLCLASRRLARDVTRLFDQKLRPEGLRATQYSVLAMLAARGGSRRGALAADLGLDRTTLTRSLAVLESRGWIRMTGSDDARERPVEITPAGRAKLEQAFPAWQAAQREATAKWKGLRVS